MCRSVGDEAYRSAQEQSHEFHLLLGGCLHIDPLALAVSTLGTLLDLGQAGTAPAG